MPLCTCLHSNHWNVLGRQTVKNVGPAACHFLAVTAAMAKFSSTLWQTCQRWRKRRATIVCFLFYFATPLTCSLHPLYCSPRSEHPPRQCPWQQSPRPPWQWPIPWRHILPSHKPNEQLLTWPRQRKRWATFVCFLFYFATPLTCSLRLLFHSPRSEHPPQRCPRQQPPRPSW